MSAVRIGRWHEGEPPHGASPSLWQHDEAGATATAEVTSERNVDGDGLCRGGEPSPARAARPGDCAPALPERACQAECGLSQAAPSGMEAQHQAWATHAMDTSESRLREPGCPGRGGHLLGEFRVIVSKGGSRDLEERAVIISSGSRQLNKGTCRAGALSSTPDNTGESWLVVVTRER